MRSSSLKDKIHLTLTGCDVDFDKTSLCKSDLCIWGLHNKGMTGVIHEHLPIIICEHLPLISNYSTHKH